MIQHLVNTTYKDLLEVGKYNCTLGAQVNLQAHPIGGGGISANLSANGRTHLLFTDLTRFCSSQIDKILAQIDKIRNTKYKYSLINAK